MALSYPEMYIARYNLVSSMSDLSEEYWAAGWLIGWENDCYSRVSDSERAMLDYLTEKADGWWPESYEDVAEYGDHTKRNRCAEMLNNGD